MAINKVILMLSMSIVLGMSACVHNSKVQPSNGHIDDQNTSAAIDSAKTVSKVAGNIPKPVTDSAYLPPPKPKAKKAIYRMVV